MLRVFAFVTIFVAVCGGWALADTAGDLNNAVTAAQCGNYDSALKIAQKDLDGGRLSASDRVKFLAVRAYAQIAQGQLGTGEMPAAPDQATRDFVKSVLARAYIAGGKYYYVKMQNWDLSIADYTKALQYDPGSVAALTGRASAHLANTETDEAIADYNAVLKIGGPSSDVYYNRAQAREEDLDFAGAIADYGTAIQFDPKNCGAWGLRGRAWTALGSYAAARKDLERAVALCGGSTNLVWLHILHMRTGENDAAWLRARSAGLNLTDWPGPALAYFTGQIPAEDMTSIALRSAATAKWHQRCDGWFYLAEEAAAHGDTDKARDLFRQTTSHCNAVDYEWDAAKVELKRM